MSELYSISQLEDASGIKAHTIRIWEKRYGLLRPIRKENNVREYRQEDLEKLLDVALLIRHGNKISKLANLEDTQLMSMASDLKIVKQDDDQIFQALSLAVIDLDEMRFLNILEAYLKNEGLEMTYEKIICPFMEQIGFFKLTGSFKKVHESFVFHHFKNKIIQATEDIPLNNCKKSQCLLTFLPKEKLEKITILYLQYLSRKSGKRVVNLGSELDIKDLEEASCLCFTTHILALYNRENTDLSLNEFIQELRYKFKQQKIVLIISESQLKAANLESNDKTILITNSKEYIEFLDKMELN